MSKLSTERAIDALDTVRAYYASLTAGYPKGKDCKVIGDVMCSEIANSCLMAIKVLEQEPCKEQEIYEKAYKEGYDKGRSDGNFIGANKWIPVSERLPEENVEVLVTTKWGSITIAERYSANDYFIYEGMTTDEDEIIAWMPLPEPYKAESEE